MRSCTCTKCIYMYMYMYVLVMLESPAWDEVPQTEYPARRDAYIGILYTCTTMLVRICTKHKALVLYCTVLVTVVKTLGIGYRIPHVAICTGQSSNTNWCIFWRWSSPHTYMYGIHMYTYKKIHTSLGGM